MNPGRRLIPVIGLLFGLSVFGGCTKPPHTPIVYTAQDYITIDDSFAWETYVPAENEIIPIEIIDGQLAILKPTKQARGRALNEINYAGVMFRTGRTSGGSFTAHRLQGVNGGHDLVKHVISVKKSLAKRPTKVDGLVLLLDAVKTLNDDQLRALTNAPVVCLMLNGFQYLSPTQAEMLAGYKGRSICLDALLWIGKEQAKYLSAYEGDYLSLNSIRSLDHEAVKELCRFEGEQLHLVSLDGKTKVLFDSNRKVGGALLVTTKH